MRHPIDIWLAAVFRFAVSVSRLRVLCNILVRTARSVFPRATGETRIYVWRGNYRLSTANTDTSLDQALDLERNSVGFRIANKLTIDLENAQFDDLFDLNVR